VFPGYSGYAPLGIVQGTDLALQGAGMGMASQPAMLSADTQAESPRSGGRRGYLARLLSDPRIVRHR
jgi:hypothetical protein